MDLVGWVKGFFSSPVVSAKPETSSFDLAALIKNTTTLVTGVVDSGLNAYQTAAEKIAQIRLMNSEIATRMSDDAAAKSQKAAVESFFQNYGGILAGSAIGVLFVGLLLARK